MFPGSHRAGADPAGGDGGAVPAGIPQPRRLAALLVRVAPARLGRAYPVPLPRRGARAAQVRAWLGDKAQ